MARSERLLDGTWDFVPCGPGDDVDLDEARRRRGAHTVEVPGLWEAQGWLDLDGAAWYLRDVDLHPADLAGGGCWTLRFGGVMDEAEVRVNGRLVGGHEGAYTPFSLDVTEALRAGSNEVAVRVVDHVAGSAAHLRSAHGKQGWKGDVFPSPPSLYLTYGGIWQSITLVRHAAVTVEDVWVDAGGPGVRVEVTVRNRGAAPVAATVRVAVGEEVAGARVDVAPGTDRAVTVHLDAAGLARWSPARPTLHIATAAVEVDELVVDEASTRFGARAVGLEDGRLVLDGIPVPVRAALVQGYRGDSLYAEGTREQIEEEVRAARDAGLTMLRLHIKAFHPDYLDVCDELGMLVHCDIPVAEPLALAELDDTGEVAERCLRAAREQVTRDRSHPSVVLWSAMNEIGAEDLTLGTLEDPGYRRFAAALYRTVTGLDGTRPVIENDWVEPIGAYVAHSPILTAHWYGRLSGTYLAAVHERTRAVREDPRALLVSEFGEWALPRPAAPGSGDGPEPFWSARDLYDGLAGAGWTGTAEEFAEGTHRYKGMSDRLQIELFRTADRVAGWCVTQLTDVPHEYNGLWHLDRTPKPAALVELERACAPVLPVLLPTGAAVAYRPAWNAWAGEAFAAVPLVTQDGDGSGPVEVEVRAGGSAAVRVPVEFVPWGTGAGPAIEVPVPASAGTALVTVVATSGAGTWRTQYPLHVVERPRARARVAYVGDARGAEAVRAAGGLLEDEADGPLVVGEGALRPELTRALREALGGGRDVLVLAQGAAAAAAMPVAAGLVDLRTEWGSLPYVFTTDEDVPVLPRRTVLTTEILSVAPDVVYSFLGGRDERPRVSVGLFKPFPEPLTGVVVASLAVGPGCLRVCQLPLVAGALADDPTALAMLAALLVPAR